MAEEFTKREITLKNTSPGPRFVWDASGAQHLIMPGQQLEVELADSAATLYEKQSKAGSDLQVESAPSEVDNTNPAQVEEPDEHKNRVALAEAERDELEAGAEADKERQEQQAKKSGAQVAAETGIHMYARGQQPLTKAAPVDAPPKRKV